VFVYAADGCEVHVEVDVVVGGVKTLFFSARLFLVTLFSYFCALVVNSVAAIWLAPPLITALQEEQGAV
jgi:hypothetical protein